jgi:3-deoxy-D-manno-octulosonic-acid transferase
VARLRPRLLLIMETELWPNLLHRCAAIGCPVILANARLSERSAAGYARFPGITRDMLDSLALIAAQNAESASRFVRLGAPDERVLVTGSIKFDVCVDSQQRQQAAALAQRWQLAARPVILAASTHEGEEALVLDAFRAQREVQSDALLVLVPRHPERFNEVHARCVEGGWSVVRRSSAADVTPATDILLVDSIGELMMFYGLADVAVIGGSFSEPGGGPRGGHNPLEPAAWGKPILAGTSMFNFEQIAAQLVAAGALEQCSGASELAQCLVNLCGSEAERARRGAAAQSVVESNRGALEALFDEVRRAVLPEHGPYSEPARQPDQGTD